MPRKSRRDSKRDPKTPAMLSVLTTVGTLNELSDLAASHGNNLSSALSAAIHQYKQGLLPEDRQPILDKIKSVVNG